MGLISGVKTAAVLGGVGALLTGKVMLIRYLLRRHAAKQKLLAQTNRRSFASLPRPYQRAVIYTRKAQLSDLQHIYRAGYVPRPKAPVPLHLPRRRKFY